MDEPTKASPRLPRYWTYERIALAAAKYTSRSAFKDGDNRAYQAAIRQKLMNQVCAHMERLCRAPWTKEELIVVASRYSTREAFKRAAGGAYMAAFKWGWLDEICQHMPKRKRKHSD